MNNRTMYNKQTGEVIVQTTGGTHLLHVNIGLDNEELFEDLCEAFRKLERITRNKVVYGLKHEMSKIYASYGVVE